MPLIARVASVFRTWLHGSRLDRDLDDELQACLEELVARKMRSTHIYSSTGITSASRRQASRMGC